MWQTARSLDFPGLWSFDCNFFLQNWPTFPSFVFFFFFFIRNKLEVTYDITFSLIEFFLHLAIDTLFHCRISPCFVNNFFSKSSRAVWFELLLVRSMNNKFVPMIRLDLPISLARVAFIIFRFLMTRALVNNIGLVKSLGLLSQAYDYSLAISFLTFCFVM